MAALPPSPSLIERMGTHIFSLYKKLRGQGLAVKLVLASDVLGVEYFTLSTHNTKPPLLQSVIKRRRKKPSNRRGAAAWQGSEEEYVIKEEPATKMMSRWRVHQDMEPQHQESILQHQVLEPQH